MLFFFSCLSTGLMTGGPLMTDSMSDDYSAIAISERRAVQTAVGGIACPRESGCKSLVCCCAGR